MNKINLRFNKYPLSDILEFNATKEPILLFIFSICFIIIGLIGYIYNKNFLLIFPAIAIGFNILLNPFWGFILFSMLLPLESSFLSLGGGVASVTRILGIYIFGAWILNNLINHEKIKYSSLISPAVALIFWGAVSILWAYDHDLTISRLFTSLQLIMLLLLVINFINSYKRLNILIIALSVGCIIVTILGLSGLGVDTESELLILENQGAKEYGSYVGIAFLVGSFLFFYKNQSQRWLGFSIVLISMISLIRINQRGVLLAIGVTWLSIMFITRKKIKSIIFILFLFLLFYLSLNYLYNSGIIDDLLYERLTVQNVIETGGTGRINIWETGWRMFSDNLFTGTGLGNFPVAYYRYSNTSNYYPSSTYEWGKGPHNDIIGIAGELGLPGLILFLSFYGNIIFKDFYLLIKSRDGMSISLLIVFALMIYIFMLGLTSAFIWRKFYWVTLGLGAAIPFLIVKKKYELGAEI